MKNSFKVLIVIAAFIALGAVSTVKITDVVGLYTELANRPKISDGVNPWDYVYSETEVNNLLALKSNLAQSSRVVLVDHLQHSNTGNTNENTVYTGTIPGNSIGANGTFNIVCLVGQTNSANAKTVRVKFNGNIVCQGAVSGSACFQFYGLVHNRNSLSSQVMMYPSSAASGSFSTGTSGTITTMAINTAADITVTVTIQNALGTETCSLEAIHIVGDN